MVKQRFFIEESLNSKYFSRNGFKTSVLFNKKTSKRLQKDCELHGLGNRETFVPGWRELEQVN